MKIFALWTRSQNQIRRCAQRKRALNAILISLLIHVLLIIGAISLPS